MDRLLRHLALRRNSGYNPEGVRIGQQKKSRHQGP